MAKTAEDMSGKVHPAVKERAGEALQLLQRKASPPKFVAAYQKVKDAQRKMAKARKEAKAREAIIDPTLAASKKIAKNLGKRKARKRKLEDTKRSREGIGGSIGLGSKKRARKLTVHS